MRKKKRNNLFLATLVLLLAACSGEKDVKEPFPVVTADRMNILYIGIDNPVSVAVAGVPREDVILKCSDAVIEGDSGHFRVKVGSPGTVNIEIYTRMGKEEKRIAQKEFRARIIPDPVAYFGGKRGVDVISMHELQNTDKLELKFETFEFDMKAMVQSFDISLMIGNVEVTSRSDGANFSEDQKKYLAKAAEGTKVYIENIKAALPDGTVRSIPGITLKVI